MISNKSRILLVTIDRDILEGLGDGYTYLSERNGQRRSMIPCFQIHALEMKGTL